MNWISPIAKVPLRASSTAVLLLLLLLLLLPAPDVSAADDFEGLVAAIGAANSSSSGAITLSGDITLSAALPPITGSLTIDGGGHSISGAGKYRIFDVNGGRLTLNNLTLTKGQAPFEEYGGAIRMRNGARVSVQNALFSDNSANWGGAIMMLGTSSRLTVRGSSFAGNRARVYAGAIYAVGNTSISSSSFINNSSADTGGALVASSVELEVSNSTFHGNRAKHNGGAIYVVGGEITLTHVTMTQNRLDYGVSSAGSTLAKEASDASATTVTLRNSIVDGSGSHPDCAGGLYQNVGNLSTDGSCSLKDRQRPLA